MLHDPNDEMVLETAIHGNAEIILTFNKRDYKGIEKFSIRTMTPGEAWQKYRGKHD